MQRLGGFGQPGAGVFIKHAGQFRKDALVIIIEPAQLPFIKQGNIDQTSVDGAQGERFEAMERQLATFDRLGLGDDD